MNFELEIDDHSGFCFGVVYAIEIAQDILEKNETLYCLGDIVHNNVEVDRLKQMGLKTVDHEQFKKLRNCKVLLRAHGEPPETYKTALNNNIELIDASCPVVLKLQNSIKHGYDEISAEGGQIVIYGKQGHAEVNGLVGQTNGNAIVINEPRDIEKIDFTKPISLFSQTTMSTEGFEQLTSAIKQKMIEATGNNDIKLITNNTICRQVSGRAPDLRRFAKKHDVIIFVSGKKSSNGKMLFDVCKKENMNTHFVSDTNEIECSWFSKIRSAGICGATSTPRWLMEKIADHIRVSCQKTS